MAYGSTFIFPVVMSNQLIFQSIVFCEVDFYIYMRVLFLDILENVLIYFLYFECFENQNLFFVMDLLVHMVLIV